MFPTEISCGVRGGVEENYNFANSTLHREKREVVVNLKLVFLEQPSLEGYLELIRVKKKNL